MNFGAISALVEKKSFVLRTVNCKLGNAVLGLSGVDGMTVLAFWVPRTSTVPVCLLGHSFSTGPAGHGGH